MLPYMIGKEDVGSYKNTYEHTLRIFASKDPKTMANNSGTIFDLEMDGSANLLFNASANHYLHTEDITALGSIIISFLIKQYELMYS